MFGRVSSLEYPRSRCAHSPHRDRGLGRFLTVIIVQCYPGLTTRATKSESMEKCGVYGLCAEKLSLKFLLNTLPCLGGQ